MINSNKIKEDYSGSGYVLGTDLLTLLHFYS